MKHLSGQSFGIELMHETVFFWITKLMAAVAVKIMISYTIKMIIVLAIKTTRITHIRKINNNNSSKQHIILNNAYGNINVWVDVISILTIYMTIYLILKQL